MLDQAALGPGQMADDRCLGPVGVSTSQRLQDRRVPASVRTWCAGVGITILDACASGAITRLKGGQARPAFLDDVSSEVKGYAFLTSSSDNEAAQESERLRGSFFTYALLTGLRGAADVTGDGKVTLNEAYQFAFNETLVQTTPTQAGAQHPAYDIKMAAYKKAGDSGKMIKGDAMTRDGLKQLIGDTYKGA